MNYNKFAAKIYQTNKANGWWDSNRDTDEIHMLILSELAEALEADRAYRLLTAETQVLTSILETESDEEFKETFQNVIKDTVEDEIADTAIRILDYLYFKNQEYFILREYDLDELDPNFAVNLFAVCKKVCDRDLIYAFNMLQHIDRRYELNMDLHIQLKTRYNSLRGKKHGGKKY